MRVVDEHGERLPLVDRLEPARNAPDCSTPVTIASGLESENRGGLDRAEDVLDVEATTKPRLDLEAVDAEACAASRELEPLRVFELESDGLLAERRAALPRAADRARSPTLTTARGLRPSTSSSAKSRRFASKYSSSVPWKSR